MDNSTTTLQGDLLLENQLELATLTTVNGTLCGIAFALFCLYVHSLVPRLRDGDRKRQARFMLGYSTLLMLCGLYNMVGGTWVAQNAFIKHSNYPGGPFFYVLATFHNPATITLTACQLTVDILASAVQIWRVWVIWNTTRYHYLVIVLPSLCFFAWIGLYLRTTILQTILPVTKLPPLADGIKFREGILQGVGTILCTMLISLFLVLWQWRQTKLVGKALGSNRYMKIVAILIESYALESVWALLSSVLDTPLSTFFNESKPYIEIIAYLLVQYRIASGKAYESQREQKNLSSLHWDHSNLSRTATTQFGETGELEAGGHHDVFAKSQLTLDVLPTSSPA